MSHFFKVYNYYSHKYIYKLRFNPDISDEKYNAIINATKNEAKRLLNSRTHMKWFNNLRPESLIMNSNSTYYNYHQNCMHQSAFFLSKGKLYRNADVFSNVMYEIYNEELALVPIVNRMIPNSVYYDTLLQYHKILGINGIELKFKF